MSRRNIINIANQFSKQSFKTIECQEPVNYNQLKHFLREIAAKNVSFVVLKQLTTTLKNLYQNIPLLCLSIK